MIETTAPRHCKQCEKHLLGRSDQIFCNDTCRNTFNKQNTRQQKVAPHPHQKAIFKIIQHNYEILIRLSKTEISIFKEVPIAKDRLGADFNPNYFTSTVTNKKGTWSVCFDRGWLETEHTYIIHDFPEKASI
ncbi:hypothetical protein SAMN06265348_10649 [Pedobacter westerhofensis]|uniref:DUF2116 family Zn-ribbon domain-containing protein n=1 Tax=Pedobacter westerhofensis TaxID=425512 RepID=A0A521DNR8_9SPHI|nr:hypothetical protein [Pedobacter westerhofensis]SMO73369.1 hypothetical protein SAMN06265348_10649 [Pedobacter westerhofensis]